MCSLKSTPNLKDKSEILCQKTDLPSKQVWRNFQKVKMIEKLLNYGC